MAIIQLRGINIRVWYMNMWICVYKLQAYSLHTTHNFDQLCLHTIK